MLMLCLIFNFSSVGICCVLNSEFYVVKLVVMKVVIIKLVVAKLAIMKVAVEKLIVINEAI